MFLGEEIKNSGKDIWVKERYDHLAEWIDDICLLSRCLEVVDGEPRDKVEKFITGKGRESYGKYDGNTKEELFFAMFTKMFSKQAEQNR
jgi:hypothetical protein